MAYLTLNPGPKKWATPLRSLETLINYGLIVLGIFVLGPGVYVSRNFPTWYCLFKTLCRSRCNPLSTVIARILWGLRLVVRVMDCEMPPPLPATSRRSVFAISRFNRNAGIIALWS